MLNIIKFAQSTVPQPAAAVSANAFSAFEPQPQMQQGGNNGDRREINKLNNSLQQSKSETRRLSGQLRVCGETEMGWDMQGSDKSPTKAKGKFESFVASSWDFLDQLRGKKPVPRSGAGGLWEEKGGPHEPSTPLKSSATFPRLPPSATYNFLQKQ